MSKWKTVRLGDVCEIQSGGTPSRSKIEYWKNGNIPWVKIGDFSGKYLEKTSEFITQQGLDNSSAKLFSKGTILYSIFATLGEVSILNIDATTNQAIAGIKLRNESEINIDFFYLYLKSLKDEVNRIGRGVAQNNINLSILKNFIIPLPPLETQKQIAAVLDKCTSLISKYKKILEKYDTLIKSRFIEMFGDPILNPMGWEIKPMGDLLSVLTDFSANGSYKTLDSNVIMYDEPNYALMIRTTDLESGDFRNNVKWVDEKAYNLLSKSKIYGKEIIMNKIGSAGKVYLMPELNIPVTLGRNAFLFRYKENINSVYIYFLLTSEYGQNEIKPYIRGAVTKTITKDDVRKIRIPVPPLTLQNDFVTFVQQIDKSKFAVQKSLEKAETLYKSLMQEYFG